MTNAFEKNNHCSDTLRQIGIRHIGIIPVQICDSQRNHAFSNLMLTSHFFFLFGTNSAKLDTDLKAIKLISSNHPKKNDLYAL